MGSGCPICNESKGEKRIAEVLTLWGKDFKREHRFRKLKNERGRSLPFDFVIWHKGRLVVIEYQGIQHYKLVAFGTRDASKAEARFYRLLNHDALKRKWCSDNDIPLLNIPYWQFDEIEMAIKWFLDSIEPKKSIAQVA